MNEYFVKKLHRPYFLFLLPVFFVFHGFVENFYFVPVKSALLLIVMYAATSLVFTGLFYLLLRRIAPAAVMASLVMSFHFFFGYVFDFLKELAIPPIFTKYSFLIPLFALAGLLLFVLLKKRKNIAKLVAYLNILFILLIILDIFIFVNGQAGQEKIKDKSRLSLSPLCDTCAKPDIYIIILDGYAGAEQTKDILSYDNTPFTDLLNVRGFHTIRNSRSNYNYTPYSTASILNMEYLDADKAGNVREKGNKYSFARINDNTLITFLQNNGYHFYNYSIFKVAGQASPTGGSFVPSDTKLITANTFLSRLDKDVLLNIATRFNIKWYLKKSMYTTGENNKKLFDLTLKVAESKNKEPRVVYTHLMMPHHPYYFDENGQPRSFETLSKMSLHDKDAYLSYLKYTNKKVIQLVDHIKANSAAAPYIFLLSDHGYRHFAETPGKTYMKYAFSNLISLYYPDQNYTAFPDSISNVNLFRILLNEKFGQQLPLLKDSVYAANF